MSLLHRLTYRQHFGKVTASRDEIATHSAGLSKAAQCEEDEPTILQSASDRKRFYVSDLGTSVTIYPTDANPNNPQPLAVLTQEITRSGGPSVEQGDDLRRQRVLLPAPYVSIVEFKRGQTAPSLRIVDGLNQPGVVAVSSDGTVYLTD